MPTFLENLEATIEQIGLCGSRLLVAVSGGADSVALLLGLQAIAPQSGLELQAAHLNHGLRPGLAEEDATWTRDLCRRLGVPVAVAEIDVRARAQAERLNLEEAARCVRYEFLERTAAERGCTHVAVAHTADDQVETVLHHLLRGTGLAGLRGMRASRPLSPQIALVRPLLSVRRASIEAWLASIGQGFRQDATNADTHFTRNRIRHVVLPAIEAECGAAVRESLLKMAEQADEWQTAIEEGASRLLVACVVEESSELCRLDCRKLDGSPRHLVREAFVLLWKRRDWPRQRMGFDDWDRLYRLVKEEGGAAILPGNVEAIRRGTLLALRRR